ncbi:putative alpha-glucuronidase A [Aspergillus germanicus]
MLYFIALLLLFALAAAESGIDGWLRYTKLPRNARKGFRPPRHIVGIFNLDAPLSYNGCDARRRSVIVGTVDAYTQACDHHFDLDFPLHLEEDGFFLNITGDTVHILGHNERGALYGTFEYLLMLAQGNFSTVSYASNPSASLRWTNEWDNMDGTIERGYGGLSMFFGNNTVREDLTRVAQYARPLASVRVNGVILTNVNANPITLSPGNVKGLARIADLMRPYGLQIGIALNFASPKDFGGLPTYDPLDKDVISWWRNITDNIYDEIPDFGGYILKASSEGQPGPHTYNRTLADSANLLADVPEPHGGITFFRTFGLDGQFRDNVILQIKYGPSDFQGREPLYPLVGYFRQSNVAIELQIAQEYLGQQTHTVYLPPLWRTILDADLRVDGQTSYVRDIVSGDRFQRRLGGYCGVANSGLDSTWTGSHLSMSNLYAFGRMAWDPTEDPDAIIKAWSRLTFGINPDVTAVRRHRSSSLTDVTNTHFGPNVRAGDDNKYGIWTRSDAFSISMHWTVRNGSGHAGQYPPEYGARFENIDTTPVEFLLWYHHVNYTHVLPSGDTVIQHLYNAHYTGAETAQTFPARWTRLDGKLDRQQYKEVLAQLTFQAGHAIVWRDSIVDYYQNLTGIPDELGRVGYHPLRLEAEDMQLTGYTIIELDPIESASGGFAVAALANDTLATAEVKLEHISSGIWDIIVVYFDVIDGVAEWEVYLNDRSLETWLGNNEYVFSHAGTDAPDGGSKTRILFEKVRINRGDILRVEGVSDGLDAAVLDYVAIMPVGTTD